MAGVEGIGTRRLEMISNALAERLGRPRFRRWREVQEQPPVAQLLDVDREYRERADAGKLRKIAPKRFNVTGQAWLPILHTRCGKWDFTALYSNSRRAHELGRVKDWVIIYYETDILPEGQCTVVTETQGAFIGHRVVRGREGECKDLWMRQRSAGSKSALLPATKVIAHANGAIGKTPTGTGETLRSN
ncbi:MAG: hypothetical protein ACHQAY_02815 [Hyphomicrobiales bacterium]